MYVCVCMWLCVVFQRDLSHLNCGRFVCGAASELTGKSKRRQRPKTAATLVRRGPVFFSFSGYAVPRLGSRGKGQRSPLVLWTSAECFAVSFVSPSNAPFPPFLYTRFCLFKAPVRGVRFNCILCASVSLSLSLTLCVWVCVCWKIACHLSRSPFAFAIRHSPKPY